MEHGWGFAVRHKLGGDAEDTLRGAAHNVASTIDPNNPSVYQPGDLYFTDPNRPFEEAMMVLYDDWRYYYHGGEHAPRGTYSIGTTTMEVR